MSSAVSLVRAADITPFTRWLLQNGRQIDSVLTTPNLSDAPWEMPERPTSLNAVLAVMRSSSSEEGPDLACRVVSESSIADLGVLGEVMLGGSTPREALAYLCAAVAHYSTHELFSITPVSGGAIVKEQLTLDVDVETVHVVQQYVAALIRSLCRLTGFRGEPLGRIEIMPHPLVGLTHLKHLLGPKPVKNTSRALSLFISDEVLDRPFPRLRSNFNGEPPWHDWSVLDGDEISCAGSAKVLIEAMLDDEVPTVERFATIVGVSLRTVQRRLGDEGTSFSDLLDDVRRTRALKELRTSSKQIGIIAADLGYADQPAFVRAMRRWVGVTPKQFRRRRYDSDQALGLSSAVEQVGARHRSGYSVT